MSNETPSPSPHTPLPWHTGGIFNPDTDPHVNVWGRTPAGAQSGEVVAQFVSPSNAEFIVHAVNCHEALVAALRAVTEHMDRAGGDAYGMPECPWCRAQGGLDGDNNYHLSTCELLQARAALATADASRTRGAVDQ